MDVFLHNFFNIETLVVYYPILLRGLMMTLLLCVIIVPLGILLGMFLAMVYSFHFPGVNPLIIAYVDFFRAFPPLVLLILIYYGLPFIGITLSPLFAVVLGMVLNSAAFYGEILRAGIESIASGQREAGRSTGLTALQTQFFIVLPQALKNVIPPMTSNTLELIKATSFASVVALPELLRAAKVVQGLSYNPTPLIAAAFMYYILLLPLVRIVSRMERQMISSH